MELSSTRANSLTNDQDLKKLLKRLEKNDLLGLNEIETIYTQASITELVETKFANQSPEERGILSSLYRTILTPQQEFEDSSFSNVYLDFGYLSDIIGEKESHPKEDPTIKYERMRQQQLEDEQRLRREQAKAYAMYLDFNIVDSSNVSLVQDFINKEELSLEDMRKLKELFELNVERTRFLKYVDDFKMMLKLFSPGSSAAQATQTLIDSYQFKLSQLT